MMAKYRDTICIFGKHVQNNLPLVLRSINYPCDTSQQVRNMSKHWNPKFRKERKEKFIKVSLPDMNETLLPQERYKLHAKKLGILPQRQWQERPIYFSCTPDIFETYVVPEGDGKYSSMTKEGMKQNIEFLQKKSKSYMAIKKIKQYDDNFTTSAFGQMHALDIYKNAHEALAAKDDDKLLKYVTETAYPIMKHNVDCKTIHWKFLESLEPARVVHARCTSLIVSQNMFAQVTVRFHTQQILCIYDRFGRVLHGSEILKKDVLDYIVFEKHLSNTYGVWRIHGKIIPSWVVPEPVPLTYQLKKDGSSSLEVAETVPSEVLDKENINETISSKT